MLAGAGSLPGYAAAPADHVASGTQESVPLPYPDKSDRELNDLLANWETLQEGDRRRLLTEVKLRMIRSKDRGGNLRIRTQRRFGRIVRRADGKVVRIETQVIRIRPVPRNSQGYGVGFEQRNAQRQEPVPETPPVIKVTDPSR